MLKQSLSKVRSRMRRWLAGAPAQAATDSTSDFPELAALVPYSLCGSRALRKLHVLAKDVLARQVQGDFVECGVRNGGSAATIACAFRNTHRKAWLFDSFEGMPATTERDGAFAAQFAGTYKGSEQRTREAMNIAGFPEENCIIRKGWFQDTFRSELPPRIAFLHVDCDWYESVILVLRTFYDRLSEGGVIALDDFGHFEGCREAYYDFVQERGLKPLLERFGYTQAFWVKGRLHNREFRGQWELP